MTATHRAAPRFLALGIPLALAATTPACGGARPAPPPAEPAPSTTSRPITEVPRRTVGFLDTGVWISNEIEGGRASDVWRQGDSLLVVQVRPENGPVNNSPWYAFRIWADSARDVALRLAYVDGDHRYWPKIRRPGGPWTPLDSARVSVDTVAEPESATLRLPVGPDTLWVAGQELHTSAFFDRWIDSLAALPHVSLRTIGRSARGRPIRMLELGDPAATRHVLLIGRQHPPEVTGTLALVRFAEELAGATPLADRFRRAFRVHIVPVVNPDGVDLGHWRHNTGGVDLNRDWVAFEQPETRAVRDAVLGIMEQPGAELWFGADFHSTWRDVFYTLERSLETRPAGFIDRWLRHISQTVPGYEVDDSPSGLSTPMARNWMYRRFGAPAVTYEVGDDTDRELIGEVAATAARGTMRILLEELEKLDGP